MAHSPQHRAPPTAPLRPARRGESRGEPPSQPRENSRLVLLPLKVPPSHPQHAPARKEHSPGLRKGPSTCSESTRDTEAGKSHSQKTDTQAEGNQIQPLRVRGKDGADFPGGLTWAEWGGLTRGFLAPPPPTTDGAPAAAPSPVELPSLSSDVNSLLSLDQRPRAHSLAAGGAEAPHHPERGACSELSRGSLQRLSHLRELQRERAGVPAQAQGLGAPLPAWTSSQAGHSL